MPARGRSDSICLFGTHLKGATRSSRVSKGIPGPIRPKKPQGPRHLGIPAGLERKGYPRAVVLGPARRDVHAVRVVVTSGPAPR